MTKDKTNELFRQSSFNRTELHQLYPEAATAFDELIRSNPKRFQHHKINWEGKYLHNGKQRRIQLGTIISLLNDYGYKVEIKVHAAR